MLPRIMNIADIREDNGKTIRENNLEKTHAIPVGALVEVKYDKWHVSGSCEKIHARLWVVHNGRDCDGTPLYSLAHTPITEWEEEIFGVRSWIFQSIFYGVETGYSEESLTVVEVTEDVKKGEGALTWKDDA